MKCVRCGNSKIVPGLAKGKLVVCPDCDPDYYTTKYGIKYDPETCPNHPPVSSLKRIWCCECGANRGYDLGDPADGPIAIHSFVGGEGPN